MRYKLGRFLYVAMTLLAFASSANGTSLSDERRTILLGTTKSPDNFIGIFERLIYTEAFSRLHLQVDVIQMTLPRLDESLLSGMIDVEVREWWYIDLHPELILRVDEPVFSVSFGVYTANPDLQEQAVESLPRNSNIEFRRGIYECEKAIKEIFPEERISDITTPEQGMRKLISGRTDLYCDVDLAVDYIRGRSKTQEFSSIRRVSEVGTPVRLYTYLSKRNAALAPRLNAVLKEMKAEGVFERLRMQARQKSFGANGNGHQHDIQRRSDT